MKSICVLMSTYNGAKYIQQQIDSILNQKDVKVYLLIRDDGSKDETLDIIKSYQEKDDRIKLYTGNNLGACGSFFDLLWSVEPSFDYYAFSDQDDVWFEDKLATAIDKIESSPADGIKVYCSNVTVVDQELNHISDGSCDVDSSFTPSFGNSLLENYVTGCTVVMGRDFVSLIRAYPKPARQYMHDWWIYKMATGFGTLIYDLNSYMLYRQHENNTVGLAKGILGRIDRFLKNAKSVKTYVKNQNQEFEEIYNKPEGKQNPEQLYNLPQDKQKLVEIVNHKKLKMLFNSQIKRRSKIENLVYKIWMMFW